MEIAVFNRFKRFFGASNTIADTNFNSGSKSKAKSRLQFVLVQDRASLSSEQMVAFKSELVDVIERYFVVDKEKFDIDYRRNGETTTLLINSPVLIKKEDSQIRARAKVTVKDTPATSPVSTSDISKTDAVTENILTGNKAALDEDNKSDEATTPEKKQTAV